MSASYVFGRHIKHLLYFKTEKSLVIDSMEIIYDSIRTSQDNYRMIKALQLALGTTYSGIKSE